jgi:hypothetical protein
MNKISVNHINQDISIVPIFDLENVTYQRIGCKTVGQIVDSLFISYLVAIASGEI